MSSELFENVKNKCKSFHSLGVKCPFAAVTGLSCLERVSMSCAHKEFHIPIHIFIHLNFGDNNLILYATLHIFLCVRRRIKDFFSCAAVTADGFFPVC